MRSIFGVLSLLVVLAIVGLIAKKQLEATRQPVPALTAPASPASPATGDAGSQPPATVKEQSQQIQQQYKQAIDSAMQQPRPVPDGD